jgi:predicted DNA binding protein
MEFSATFNLFLEFPITLYEKYKIGYIVGTQKNLKKFLNFVDNIGIEFEILARRKYIPAGHGALASLTPQQFKCIRAAVELGYFDLPKRKDARAIAKKLNMAHSTFLEHIRKAEKAIFEILFRA